MTPEEVQASLHRQRERELQKLREEMDVPDDLPEGTGHYTAAMDAGRWCMPSETVFMAALEMPLPKLTVKRGGLKWPWFRVETLIVPVRRRWYSRTRWELHVRYHDGERYMHHYMEFDRRDLAGNAEQIIKFTIQTVNEQYRREEDARNVAR